MAEEGVSILETESYVLAIVFLVFLAVFTIAEKVRTAVSLRFCVSRPIRPKALSAVAGVATSSLDTAT